jgi:hypothetical protein
VNKYIPELIFKDFVIINKKKKIENLKFYKKGKIQYYLPCKIQKIHLFASLDFNLNSNNLTSYFNEDSLFFIYKESVFKYNSLILRYKIKEMISMILLNKLINIKLLLIFLIIKKIFNNK